MKHMKAKGILAIAVIAALTLGLAAVYSRIGVDADLDYAKRQCSQKTEGLTTSVGNLISTYTNVFYSYENVLKTNAALAALPLGERCARRGMMPFACTGTAASCVWTATG